MSLASAAILAPLLMSLLWVTLRIGRELKTGLEGDGQYGTIGGFFANPVNVGNLDAIFMYILMVGLLYKCFQLTRDFSTNITRFNLTGGFLKGPFGTALGLGFLGGAKATQGSVGWGAAAGLRAIRRSGWTSKGGLRGMVARRTATALNSMRKASFNPLRTDLGAKAAKAVGVPGMFLDKKISEGGFAGAMGRKAKAADELARQIGPTQGQREEVRGQAEAQMREHRRIARENMEGIIRGQQRTLATLMERERPQAEERARQSQADRPRVEAAIRQQQEELTRVATQRESARNRQESEMRATERIIDAAQRGAEQRRLENVHTGELTQFSERERQARETLALNQGLLGRLDAVAERLTNEQLAEHEEIAPLRRSIEQNTAQLREHDQQNEGKIREAGREAERQGDLTLRSALLWDKRAIPDIEDEMRAHGRRQQWADFRALHREDERADRPAGGTPPAAPAGGGH
jgi:hypothetical protein